MDRVCTDQRQSKRSAREVRDFINDRAKLEEVGFDFQIFSHGFLGLWVGIKKSCPKILFGRAG